MSLMFTSFYYPHLTPAHLFFNNQYIVISSRNPVIPFYPKEDGYLTVCNPEDKHTVAPNIQYCLITRTSNIMLNKVGDSEHPFLMPDLIQGQHPIYI